MRLTVRHSSAPEFKSGDKVHLQKKGSPGIIVEHVRRRNPQRIVLIEAEVNFVNTNATETTLEIAGWVRDGEHDEAYAKRFLIMQ